jgi:hypothetical protein
MKFVGKIRGLGSHYVETGLERVEIWINKSDAEGMPYELGERVAIELIIGSKMFTAGLRATEGTPYVWVSPDLVDDDGYEVSLAEILHENGFQKNQVVTLFFDFPDVWLEAVE